MNTEIENLKRMLDEQRYIYDEELIITLFVALKLERPLLMRALPSRKDRGGQGNGQSAGSGAG